MPQIQAGLTEPTFLPLPETADGTVAAEAAEPLLERLGAADALAIGPGLTTNEQTVAFVRDVVRAVARPARARRGRAQRVRRRRSHARRA